MRKHVKVDSEVFPSIDFVLFVCTRGQPELETVSTHTRPKSVTQRTSGYGDGPMVTFLNNELLSARTDKTTAV